MVAPSLLILLSLLSPLPDPVEGRVVDPGGQPVAGAIITIRTTEAVTVSVYADGDGRFRLPEGTTGPMTIRAPGYAVQAVASAAGTTVELTPLESPWRTLPSNRLLGLLPGGEDTRRFILDCGGCHQFDAVTIGTRAGQSDSVKDYATWQARVAMMLGFAGAQSGFPVIAPTRDPVGTALLLSRHVTAKRRDDLTPQAPAAPIGEAVLTEYFLPAPSDLPHDVALTPEGQVLITGMFTHRMYVLDPATGSFSIEAIPTGGSNPRAVEVGPDGAWWVLLGNPRRIARRQEGAWTSWDVGLYGHSIGVAPDGRVWTNGHFTRDPEQIVVLDPATGAVRPITVPGPPADGGGINMQYELRVAPDGAIWTSQLLGNRIIRYDPATGRFRHWEMPTPHSGPRRFDIAPDGRLWIPEFANNRLAVFDPAAGTFEEWELPVEHALPYVARVDTARQVVWIGTGAADVLLRFDMRTEQFTVFPLPSPGAVIRHLAIDPATGTVWAANGASPARAPVQIVRVEPGAGSREP